MLKIGEVAARIGITFALLVAAFYFTYRKREVACADGTCKVSSAPRWNKALLWMATVVVILFAAFPYYSGPLLAALNRGARQQAEPGTPATAQRLTKARLMVSGMTCGSCAASLEAALAEIPGATSAKASYEKGEAIVEYDATRVTTAQLSAAVKKASFKAEAVKVISPNPVEADGAKSQLATATIRVEGMTCGGCVASVRQALAKGEGITSIEICFEKKRAIVKYDPAKVTPEQLVEVINQTGFKARKEAIR